MEKVILKNSMNRILLMTVVLTNFMIKIGRCGYFELMLLHSNNINFQFDETADQIGGAGRALYMLKKFRKDAELGKGLPVLYLNAGDNFAISNSHSSGKWEIVADFINTLKPDVMCLGNHDFDIARTNFTLFLNKVTSPVVGANFDFSFDESLSERIKPSHIFTIHNRTIGVVGYISSRYKFNSKSGQNMIRDEVKSVRRECEMLRAMGVNIIIALGHGEYEVDKTIAREVENVDVVVTGGYKRTWKTKEGNYRSVVRRRNGKKIPIVYEYGYMKYLGMLAIQFDQDGEVKHFNGQPIALHKNIPQATEARNFLRRYKRSDPDEVLGRTATTLSGKCTRSECNYGNLICDALCSYWASNFEKPIGHWTSCALAAIAGGLITGDIHAKRNVNLRDLTQTMNYDTSLVMAKVNGRDIKQALEQALKQREEHKKGFFQVAGLRARLNMSKSVGSRVSQLYIRCSNCEVPKYERMSNRKDYKIILDEYLVYGGDSVRVFRSKTIESHSHITIGKVVAAYFKENTIIWPETDGRLSLSGKCSKLSVLQPAIVIILAYLLSIF